MSKELCINYPKAIACIHYQSQGQLRFLSQLLMDSHKGRVTPGPTWEKTFIATSSGAQKDNELKLFVSIVLGIPSTKGFAHKARAVLFCVQGRHLTTMNNAFTYEEQPLRSLCIHQVCHVEIYASIITHLMVYKSLIPILYM